MGTNIAIIGGGLAGLTAAYLLQKEGKGTIQLFEATDRVGGRCYTLRNFSSGLFAEAGALSITDTDHCMQNLAKELGVELEPRPDRGKKRFFTEGKWGDKHPYPYYMAEIWDEIQRIKDMVAPPKDWGQQESPYLDHLDSMSIIQYFVGKGKDEKEIRAAMASTLVGLSADNLDELSALYVFRFISQFVDCKQVSSVKGGNDRLPQALAKKLGKKVILNSPVVSLKRVKERWSITFKGGKVDEFDTVILATSIGALQKIDLPDLPPAQKEAIAAVHTMQSVARVFCEVKGRFWKEDQVHTAMALTDTPTLWIEDHTAAQKGERAVLEAHACCDKGFEMARAKDILRFGEEQIASTYGETFRRHLDREKTCVHLWSQEPYQLGAYPYFKPGQRKLVAQITEPFNGLFFVGEYTSAENPASMEGAVQSAYSAVKKWLS